MGYIIFRHMKACSLSKDPKILKASSNKHKTTQTPFNNTLKIFKNL